MPFLEVKDLRVRSLDVDFHELSWKLTDTSEDVLDYTFQVLRSESPEGPFDELTPPLVDRYVFIDNVIQVANRWRKYYYRLHVAHNMTGETKDFGPVAREPDPDIIAQELRRHMQLLFQEFAGRRCWILPARTFGQRCFLPGTPMEGAVIGASRAMYKGKVIQLTTKEGRRLTVTANHPVLTAQGFIPAQEVRVGDNLVCYGLEIDGVLPVTPYGHEEQKPALAEDVFRTLAKLSGSNTTRAVGLDFHGEAQRFIGDVEVVGSYRDLLMDGQAPLSKSLSEGVFEHSSMGEVALHGMSSTSSFPETLDPSPGSFMRRSNLLLPGRLVHEFPGHVARFGVASQTNAPLLECVAKSASRNSDLPSKLLQRGAGLVLLDQVVDVREDDYLGHVYDFETLTGWIIASDIFTSNCECWNPSLQQRRRSGCLTCFDTGWVRGYLSPIETWVQFDPSPKSNQNTAVGKLQQSNTTARFGYYPQVKPEDLIIEGENRRWKVVSVVGTEQSRATIHQEVQLHEVPPRDIEFRVPLNMDTALKDLWLSPSRNFTNPQNLEEFLDAELPGIFNLYPNPQRPPR